MLTIVMLGVAVVSQAVEVQPTDPPAVLQRYIDAQHAGDVEAALALWAENGVMTNTQGGTFTGREELRRFIQGNITRNIRQAPESIETIGEKVTWINPESQTSYQRLKVAPVQQHSEIIVQNGHIISWVDYFPTDEIARIEQACATPQGQRVLLNDQPCHQFIEQAKAHTARVTGASTSGPR
jgi:ketosteroid isomerase-like protein